MGAFDTDNLSEGPSNLYFTNERVDDRVNALIVDSDGIVATYDDPAGTLTLTTDAGLAGAGFTYSSGVINVVGGDGLTASANSLDVDSTVVRTTGTQTIAGAKTFSDNMVVSGNLTVNGTTTTINSQQFQQVITLLYLIVTLLVHQVKTQVLKLKEVIQLINSSHGMKLMIDG